MGAIEKNPSKKPPKVLYHYTSQTGLLEILKKKEIWATHIDYLNDVKEFVYTFDLVRKELNRRRESFSTRGLPGIKKSKEMVDFIDRLATQLDGRGYLHTFVCSFTAQGDLLSQWRGYCPSGNGFSLGFESSQLSVLAERQGFRLKECVYNLTEQEKIVKQLVDAVLNEFQAGKEGPSDKVSTMPEEPDIKRDFRQNILQIAPFLKHSSFSEEQEWRLISERIEISHPQVDFREKRSMIIPYFKIKLVENNEGVPIKHVIVGPTPDKESSKDSVEAFLYVKGVKSCRVDISETPYREL